MARIEAFRREVFPVNRPLGCETTGLIHTRSADEVIVALFSGPWHSTAADAFQSAIQNADDGSSCEAPFKASIRAIHAYWSALSDEDRMEQGWFGTACGIALHVSPVSCVCTWLGDNQAFHLRDGEVIHSIAPHSVYQAMRDGGNPSADRKLKHLLTRWFAADHASECVTWFLQPGDLVMVASPHIDERLLPEVARAIAPDAIGSELLKVAAETEPRVSHGVLEIWIREGNTP